MNLKFKKWLDNNRVFLYKKNIKVENVVTAGEQSNDPSTRADFLSNKYLGCVTVWRSGSVDLEILDIEKISTVFFDSKKVDVDINFDMFLEKFFYKLLTE